MQLSGKATGRLRTGGTHHLLMKESVLVQKGLGERVVMKKNSAKSCNLAQYYAESCISLQSHLQPRHIILLLQPF